MSSSALRVLPSPLLLMVLPLLIAGCPDLGDAPFICNNGDPACPSGYRCDETYKVCVREGVVWKPPGTPDVATPDVGADLDAVTPDEGITPTPDKGPPQAQKTIVITEFMADPEAVLDSAGEYVELFNLTSSPIDINGWTIKDDGADTHTINAGGSLMVPPMGYLVLAINKNPAQNGGVAAAYQYSNFFLSNKADEILLIDTGGKIVDKFAYDDSKGWVITTGASLSLKNPFLDNNTAANWCTENAAWSGSLGDKGSPAANPGCL